MNNTPQVINEVLFACLAPHFGHDVALVLTFSPHSLHFMIATIFILIKHLISIE